MDDAFEQFYHRYARYVRVLCIARTQCVQDAEDVASLAWLDIYRNFERYQVEEPKALLAGLVTWRARDLYRSSYLVGKLDMKDEQLLELFACACVADVNTEQRLMLCKALEQETPEDREILFGRFIEEKTWDELAQQYKLHRNTVWRRATVSLARLRECL